LAACLFLKEEEKIEGLSLTNEKGGIA